MDDKYLSYIKTIRTILIFFAGLVILFLIKLLSKLLIPFVLALFLAMLVQPILAWLGRKKVPFGVSLGIIWVFFAGIIYGFGTIIYHTGIAIYAQHDILLELITRKLLLIEKTTNQSFGLGLNFDNAIVTLHNLISKEFLLNSGSTVAGFLGSFTETFLLMLVYLALLLGSILKYEKYLKYIEGDRSEKKLLNTFEQVKTAIGTYMRVKFIVSLTTGIIIYFILLSFQVKFALFWAFLIFVANFLPSIGFLVGIIPPIAMGLIQFDQLSSVLILALLLLGLHVVLSNILEPIFMGHSVSLNTIVIIMGLLFWGYLWGLYGMILSVPLMVLIKVILGQIEGAEMISRLLGGGDISPPGAHHKEKHEKKLSLFKTKRDDRTGQHS